MTPPLPRFPGLWLGLLVSLTSGATAQTRYPVISKVDIVFSLVAHRSHIQGRINFYNSYGQPAGNSNYVVPHLVYEPIVTLYNPCNEPLTMNRSRIQIWDPPVGFSFKKNNVFLRDEFAVGPRFGLARFQIANESIPSARKSFTLSLSSPAADGQPGQPIVLQPGETKTFSTWVEPNWNWGLETAGGYTPRAFYDWNALEDLTNTDRRTGNLFGVEAISSPFLHRLNDPRAGFQTDWLSLANGRPYNTRYDFEIAHDWSGGWVAIKNTDTISVQAKAFPASYTLPFQTLLLRGQLRSPAHDTVKGFSFNGVGIHQDEENPVISRTFLAGELLQSPTDMTPGGKSPFAALSMLAKSDALRGNHFYATPAVPTASLYELHFTELADFTDDLPLTPSDTPAAGFEIFGSARIGNTLYLDYRGPANKFGYGPGFFRGSATPDGGFTEDLASRTTVMAGQSGSGIYKAVIDVAGLGDHYFVRIEY